MKPRALTQKWVDAQKPGKHEGLTRDKDVRGLMLSVNKTSKSWRLQRDLPRPGEKPRTIKLNLGRADVVSLRQAKAEALEKIAAMKRGEDPRDQAQERPKGPADWTLEELWDNYEAWMITQERSPVTVRAFRYHLGAYLVGLHGRRLGSILKSEARAEHGRITKKNKKYPANHAMRSLRAAYNWAVKMDDHHVLKLEENPVGGVTFHTERKREASILPENLEEWWKRTESLSPLRGTMHRLGLLSGLRPGTLVSIERSWIDKEARRITIPVMKSGQPFELPISRPMLELIEEAERIGDALYRDPPYLFPTRSADGKRVIATQVWKERTMKGEVGHILRKTHQTMATSLRVTQDLRRALLDHKQPGIEAHYQDRRGLWDDMMAAQEKVSAYIIETAGGL